MVSLFNSFLFHVKRFNLFHVKRFNLFHVKQIFSIFNNRAKSADQKIFSISKNRAKYF